MVQPQLLLIGISYISLLVLSIFIVLFVLHYRKKQIGFLAQNAIVQFQYKNEITQAQLEIGQLTMRRTVQNIQNKVGQTLALASMQIRSLQNERMSSTLHPEDLISEALQELRSLTQTLNSDYH